MEYTTHTRDLDCSGHIDPDTNLCRVCSVEHGAPCPTCGQRAYHAELCIDMLEHMSPFAMTPVQLAHTYRHYSRLIWMLSDRKNVSLKTKAELTHEWYEKGNACWKQLWKCDTLVFGKAFDDSRAADPMPHGEALNAFGYLIAEVASDAA